MSQLYSTVSIANIESVVWNEPVPSCMIRFIRVEIRVGVVLMFDHYKDQQLASELEPGHGYPLSDVW